MRSTSLSLALAPVLVMLVCPVALAQYSSPRLATYGYVSHYPVAGIFNHSSTAYEGALRGQAAWISAYGDYLVNEGRAAYIWENVESLHYDNELKKTVTALSRKKILADYREQERQQRRDRKKAAKKLWQEKYLDLAHAYRLDEYEFNWETGAIYWPAMVAGPRYTQHRQKLATLMSQAVRYGMTDLAYRDQIARACADFRNQLREDAIQDHTLTSSEYLAMQRFLLGLKYAPYLMAQAPTGEQLARN